MAKVKVKANNRNRNQEPKTDDRPVFHFDFGPLDTEPLRERLLLEAAECLARAGKPQVRMIEEVRGYLKNKGTVDVQVYPILRIVSKYLRIQPSNWYVLIDLLGWDRAIQFVPGVKPPVRAIQTIDLLIAEKADIGLIWSYKNELARMLDSGEENPFQYVALSMKYRYDYRGLEPGYTLSTSTALATRSA